MIVRVEALGVVIGVKIDDKVNSAAFTRAWTPAVLTDHVVPDAVIVAPDGPPDLVLEELSQRVTRAAIEQRAGGLLMFHAGALADVASGRCVIFIGMSGAGKTTAVKTLGTKHLAYVTDETVGLDARGSITRYVKPLSILMDGNGPKQQVAPGELGLATATGPLRASACVLLNRDPARRSSPECVTIGTVEAVARVAPHTSRLARLHRPLHVVAEVLERVGGAQVVTYRECNDLEMLIPRWLGG